MTTPIVPNNRKLFRSETLGELMSDNSTARIDWLVEDLIQAQCPTLWTAEKKTCKTTLAVELALAVATGNSFLGHATKKSRVLFVSVEDGRAAIRQRHEHRIKTLGIAPPNEDLILGTRTEALSKRETLDELTTYLSQERIGLLILDPAYLLLGDYQQTSLNDVGARLFAISNACDNCGTTCVVIHHAKRNGRGLSAASGAGFAEWAGNWMSIERVGAYRKDGVHQLRLDYGGRAGHQGEIRIKVDEGLQDGRRTMCDIQVTANRQPPVDSHISKNPRRSPQLDDVRTAIQQGFQTVTAIQGRVGGSKRKIENFLKQIQESSSRN